MRETCAVMRKGSSAILNFRISSNGILVKQILIIVLISFLGSGCGEQIVTDMQRVETEQTLLYVPADVTVIEKALMEYNNRKKASVENKVLMRKIPVVISSKYKVLQRYKNFNEFEGVLQALDLLSDLGVTPIEVHENLKSFLSRANLFYPEELAVLDHKGRVIVGDTLFTLTEDVLYKKNLNTGILSETPLKSVSFEYTESNKSNVESFNKNVHSLPCNAYDADAVKNECWVPMYVAYAGQGWEGFLETLNEHYFKYQFGGSSYRVRGVTGMWLYQKRADGTYNYDNGWFNPNPAYMEGETVRLELVRQIPILGTGECVEDTYIAEAGTFLHEREATCRGHKPRSDHRAWDMNYVVVDQHLE